MELINVETKNKVVALLQGDLTATEYNVYKLLEVVEASDALKKCTPESVQSVLLDVVMNGLDIDDVYITPRGRKVGDSWISEAKWSPKATGQVKKAVQGGVLAYVDEPVVVYDCDTFRYTSTNGVEHEAVFPRVNKTEQPDGTIKETPARMIACYVRLTRPNGSSYYSVMDITEYKALAASALREALRKEKNATEQKKAELWEDIWAKYQQVGMFKTKCLKHATSNNKLPKMKFFGKAITQETEDITHEIQ